MQPMTPRDRASEVSAAPDATGTSRSPSAPEGAVIALILAGGSGTRLWPHSRRGRPKQLLALVGEQSMVAETVSRLAPLVPPERVLVVTNQQYVDAMVEALPEIPAANIVGEPAALGTAPAIALGTALAAALDPEAVLIVLSADHHIGPREAFQETMSLAVEVARTGRLVTIGIPPAYPETGFGYIELGAPLDGSGPQRGASPGEAQRDAPAAYDVVAFHEKPDRATAEAYVAGGDNLWNAGIFAWRLETIREAFHAFLPELGWQLDALTEAALRDGLGSADLQAAIEITWPAINHRTTIDYGILERAQNVAAVSASFRWSDIGSWEALGAALAGHADSSGNVTVGSHLLRDANGCLVFNYGDRLVAAVGIQDLVIVATDDVVLVCPRERVQEIKGLVENLPAAGREDLC